METQNLRKRLQEVQIVLKSANTKLPSPPPLPPAGPGSENQQYIILTRQYEDYRRQVQRKSQDLESRINFITK